MGRLGWDWAKILGRSWADWGGSGFWDSEEGWDGALDPGEIWNLGSDPMRARDSEEGWDGAGLAQDPGRIRAGSGQDPGRIRADWAGSGQMDVGPVHSKEHGTCRRPWNG